MSINLHVSWGCSKGPPIFWSPVLPCLQMSIAVWKDWKWKHSFSGINICLVASGNVSFAPFESLSTCAPTPMEMLRCAKCMYTLYSLMVYVLNVYVLVHKMGTVCIFPSPLPRSLEVSEMSHWCHAQGPKIKGRHAASGTACKAATSSALWRSWPSGGQMRECPVKNLPPQRRYSWHFVEILQTEVQSRFAGGTMVGSLGLISNRVMD